ncbi:MAG: histidine phosphatase family protein [Patescibacteria group bacterium]
MSERLKQKISKRSTKISFWFIRHGQSEDNVFVDQATVMNDAPLTERGRREAVSVASYFKKNGVRVTDIYSSPLGRSYQTAEVIADALNLPIKARDGLRERNWGAWKDMKWFEVAKNLENMSIDGRFGFIPEGGESWEQMERRLFSALEEIADENDAGENILIVTHKGCLRAVLPILGKAGRDRHEEFSVETGTLTKFSFDKDTFDFVGLRPEVD